MSGLGNKEIMARNLMRYVEKSGKTQKEIADFLNIAPSTFNAWVQAKKYPRIDKIEMMANYFGCLKSDLIEDKSELQKSNEAIAAIIARMRTDMDFLSLIKKEMYLDKAQIQSVEQLLTVMLKQSKD